MPSLNNKEVDRLRSEHVLIVGLGARTGVAVANALTRLRVPFAVSDRSSREALADTIELLDDRDTTIFTGEQTPEQLEGMTLVVLSPGVPATIPLIAAAHERGIPVISEIELGYRLLEDVRYFAITGTDGKTTTTLLLGAMLSKAHTTHVLGNIGQPLTGKLFDIEPGDCIVLELSSYQLETIDRFRPHVASILNLHYDHLDRYADMDAYFDAKKRITMNQTDEDYLILNADNPYTERYSRTVSHTMTITFSATSEHAVIVLDGDDITIGGMRLCSLKDTLLIGVHNRENILAAATMARAAGVAPNLIEDAIREFSGVPHRMEEVATIDGVLFVNDSKATTLQAVEKALLSFRKKVVLIMGGKNKGLDFTYLRSIVSRHVRVLICTGDAAGEIADAIAHPNTIVEHEFDDAVRTASREARSSEVVLLSPGCASFDRFRNYEERGNRFKALVHELVSKTTTKL